MRNGFNEAPANSPGNALEEIRGLIRPAIGGFNEAPANSPGNVSGAFDIRGRIDAEGGFNEAPANSPGNVSRHLI